MWRVCLQMYVSGDELFLLSHTNFMICRNEMLKMNESRTITLEIGPVSEFTIINDITKEIRSRIFSAMTTSPGVTLGFTSESTDILIEPPTDAGETGMLSMYLYHVGINNSLRNQNMLANIARADEQRLPPLPIELHYICTPIDSEEDTNQLVLGRLLQFVYDAPTIREINSAPLGNSFGGASSELRITPDLLNVEQLSQLWNAFGSPYRLSLAFKVDVVAIDSAKTPTLAPRVTEVFSVSGQKRRAE